MARSLSSGNNLSVASAVLTAVPITIAGWFKLSSLTGTKVLISLDDDTTDNRFYLDSLATTGVIRAITTAGGTSNTAASTAGATAGAWGHAAAVFAGVADRRAFFNGGNKGTNTTSRTPSGISRTRFGQTAAAGQILSGDLAEFAVWNVALSDAEVALLATGVGPYAVQPGAIVAYWPLLGAVSPEPDAVGAFPMTLSGTPPQAAHPFVFYGKNRFRRRGLLAA